MNDDGVFRGFPTPEDGYTKFPNIWFDILMRINNMAEMKVVLYVMRHTWGYQNEEGEHERMKVITLDEFAYGRRRRNGTRIDSGTGMGISSVRDGLKRAIEHRYLIHEVDETDLARVEHSYGLRMLEKSTENQHSEYGNSVPGVSNFTTRSKGDNKPELTNINTRSEKENSKETYQKETEEKAFTPSLFCKKTLEYIEKKKEQSITFYQLEKFLRRFFRVRGPEVLWLTDNKNAVVWDKISLEFCAIFDELVASNQVTVESCTEEMYLKGRKLKLPVTRQGNCDEPRWYPMVIRLKKERTL